MSIKRFGMLLLALAILLASPAICASAEDDKYEGDAESSYDDRLATLNTVASGDWLYCTQEDGSLALERYQGEAEALTVPDSLDGHAVTVIDSFCFPSNTLQSITLGKGIRELREDAFLYAMATEIILNDGLTVIGPTAFMGCDQLVSLAIPDSVVSIGSGALRGCTALKALTLPQQLAALPDELLMDCDALLSLHVPASVQSIGEDALPANDGFTLTAPAGSYAETYAKANNIAFEPAAD